VPIRVPTSQPAPAADEEGPQVGPARFSGADRQRVALVDGQLPGQDPQEPPAGKRPRQPDAHGDVTEVEQGGGHHRRQDAASRADHADRGELRRGGEDQRRHQDRGPAGEMSRHREHAEGDAEDEDPEDQGRCAQ